MMEQNLRGELTQFQEQQFSLTNTEFLQTLTRSLNVTSTNVCPLLHFDNQVLFLPRKFFFFEKHFFHHCYVQQLLKVMWMA